MRFLCRSGRGGGILGGYNTAAFRKLITATDSGPDDYLFGTLPYGFLIRSTCARVCATAEPLILKKSALSLNWG